MKNRFVSSTQVQRQTKAVFDSEDPFQIVLNNNEVSGIIVNKATAKMLLDSDILEQIAEELWEVSDPLTCEIIEEARAGKNKDAVDFFEWEAEHGV